MNQNINLMINGARLQDFVLNGESTPLKSYDTSLAKNMCNPPTPECYTNECQKCPGLIKIKWAIN